MHIYIYIYYIVQKKYYIVFDIIYAYLFLNM